MADLSTILLVLLAVLGAAALIPDLRPSRRRDPAFSPGWVAAAGPLLAVLLGLECGATLASNVLAHLGGTAALAAVSGVLVSGALGRRLPWRALGLVAVLVITMPVLLVLSAATANAFGGNASPFTTLSAEMAGKAPANFEALALLTACWGSGAWIGWMALRERSGVLACAAPMVLVTADLVNVVPDLQGAAVWPVLGAVVCGAALVGWTNQDRRLARWRKVAPDRPVPRSGMGLVLISAVVIGLVGLVLPPMNRTNFSSRFFHSGPLVTTGVHNQLVAPVAGYSTEVVPGGPIREVATPVLSYATSAPGGSTYLAGVTLTGFSNGNWYAGSEQALETGQGSQIPYSERPAADTSATAVNRLEVSLQVTYQGSAAQEVPDLLYAGSPVQTPYAQGRYRVSGLMQGGQFLSVSSVTARGGTSAVLPTSLRLTTYGTISTATPAQLEAAGTNYPSWVLPDTSLPPLGNFLQASQVAADALAMSNGAANPYLAAINIQNSLRAEEIYTLDPPKAPAGEWPIVYFLDQSHRGYCQYFASAMGAMLRTLGIPARLVNGFGPGQEGQLKNGQWLITEADAHTWVQVYFPHYGWVNFEPTPDGFYQPTGAAAQIAPVAIPPASGLVHHPGVRSVPASGKVSGPRLRSPARPLSSGAIAAGVAGLVLLLALAGVAWSRRVRTAAGLRRRLELPVRLARAASPHGQTLAELSDLCAGLRPRAQLNGRLLAAAAAGDRLAFGRGGEAAELELLAAWGQVRGSYPALLLAALRARRRGPAARPGAVVVLSRVRSTG